VHNNLLLTAPSVWHTLVSPATQISQPIHMQITIETLAASAAELNALSRFIGELAALSTAPTTVTGKVIDPADRPDAGKPPAPALPPAPPAIVEAITQAATAANSPAAPTLDPAAIFGAALGAMRDVPAVPPAAPSVPVVPPLPVGVHAAPPPAPSAPTAPAVPTPPAAAPSGTEVDARGLPWDGRIHSSTRAKNQDGTWRQKRGLNDEALLKRIENELRMAMAARAAVPAPPAPPAVPGAPAAGPTEFGPLMEAVSKLIMDKRVTPDAVNAALTQHLGLPGLIGLASRPDLIPQAWGIVQTLLVPA